MEEKNKNFEDLKKNIENLKNILEIDKKIKEKNSLEKKMNEKDFWNDTEKASKISKKYEFLSSEIEKYEELKKEFDELYNLFFELEKEEDYGLKKEIEKQFEKLKIKFEKIEFLSLMNSKHDRKNAIISLHAGSGGVDAQDWTEMLSRMYMRYAEKKDWKYSILEETRASEAGLKSIVIRIEGNYAYGYLKVEHGTHRLVRISPFDAESMRHTSFALVEVLPEIEEEEFELDEKDLRIDTFMAGGHGGQSVNTTYSAVRVVHIPTNISVSCQNERSQLQNKETAIKILKSKLQKLKEIDEEKEKQKIKGEHKIPEWGSQIRSYVLNPYKMVKDLRSGWESKDPDKILDGDLDAIIESVLKK